MIPLYGFLQGDTIGLLILATENMSMRELGEKLSQMAQLRVPLKNKFQVFIGDKEIPLETTVREAGLTGLERVDVRDAL